MEEEHLQFLQVVLEVRRGGHEDQRAAVSGHLVDVRGKADAVNVEAHAGEVRRVVSLPLEFLHGIGAAHIPPEPVHLLQEHLGNGRCPASAAQHRNVS